MTASKRHVSARTSEPEDAGRWTHILTDRASLGTETVEGAAGALESVDDVESGDGLPLGVLSIGDGVTNDLEWQHR